MSSTDASLPRSPMSLGHRVGGALRLDARAFEDIEHDPHALRQAALVVALAGAARGLGAYATEGAEGLVGSTLLGIALWLGASVLIWVIGVQWLRCRSNLKELLRTLGFATAPLLLLAAGALGIAPLRAPIWWCAHAWAIGAVAVATRQALDLSVEKALAVCALAFAAGFGLVALIGMFVVEWGAFD